MPTRASIKRRWKKNEQLAAEFFGGKRVPLSGSNSGHNTSADIMQGPSWLYAEHKERKRIALFELFKSTKKKAQKENKIPVILQRQVGSHGMLITVHQDDWAEVVKLEYRRLNETTEN